MAQFNRFLSIFWWIPWGPFAHWYHVLKVYILLDHKLLASHCFPSQYSKSKAFQTCLLFVKSSSPTCGQLLSSKEFSSLSLFLKKVYIYSPSFLSLIVSCLQEGHLPRTGELYARDKSLDKYLKINILKLTLLAELKRKISWSFQYLQKKLTNKIQQAQ